MRFRRDKWALHCSGIELRPLHVRVLSFCPNLLLPLALSHVFPYQLRLQFPSALPYDIIARPRRSVKHLRSLPTDAESNIVALWHVDRVEFLGQYLSRRVTSVHLFAYPCSTTALDIFMARDRSNKHFCLCDGSCSCDRPIITLSATGIETVKSTGQSSLGGDCRGCARFVETSPLTHPPLPDVQSTLALLVMDARRSHHRSKDSV